MRMRSAWMTSLGMALAACGGGGGGGSPSNGSTQSMIAQITASSLAFGTQLVDTTSPKQVVGLSNTGTLPISISGVTLAGTNPTAFTISNNCGTTLAVNTDCMVTVAFSPTAMGSMSGRLQFQTNLATSPSVALSGTGAASIATVSSAGLMFSNQVLTTGSPAQTVKLSNTGNATLNISGLSIVGASALMFTESDDCTGPIAPAASCSIGVTFAPNAAGPQSAVLSVNSDSLANASVALTGIGILPPPPIVSAASLPVNVLGVVPTSVSASLTAKDPTGLSLQYVLATAPTQGSATVNSTTGALSYQIQGYPSSPAVTTDTFSVIVSNGYTSSAANVNVSLNSDPLLPNQWHIQNTGQNAFSTTLPVAGNDMDVAGAWGAGYSGKGIKVGVVDTGLEAAHEDLAANVDLTHSYNFLTGTNDPTPTTPGFDHGTAVSGIIGAVAFNGKGGRGIAYNATLRGYNLIAAGADSDANLAESFGGMAASADNDVFNASFGDTTPSLQTQDQVAIQTDIATTALRGGLGAPLVYAAGNNFVEWENQTDPLCAQANTLGVSCGDPANDEHNEDSIPIIVAALNAAGTHATYSSTGASVWIAAYGGEYGLNQSYVPGGLFAMLSDPTDDLMPAIITTNFTGCANTYNPFNPTPPVPLNALNDLGANPLAATCQYTATMNGTSAATPNVTSVVALMLQANPSLTYRDVKHILATTAKQVDPTFAGVSAPIFNSSNVTLEQGWTRNAAGYWFSNRYGFGGVDASAAVQAASTYTSHLPTLQASSTYQALASANNGYVLAGGYRLQFNVQEAFSSIEQVLVTINIFEAHDGGTSGLACAQAELTSPSGTNSILMHAGNGFVNAAVNGAILESNAFYGEPVNGIWTLTFYDFCTYTVNPTLLSLSVPQTLFILGH